MTNIDCIFGEDCPIHGGNCINCDAGPTTGTLVTWGLEIDRHGYFRFFVYDRHWQQYYMCMEHFLARWGLNEEHIARMVSLNNLCQSL